MNTPRIDAPRGAGRWFPLPLRSLVLIAAVAAIPCSWRPPEMQRRRDQEAIVAAIQKLGGRVRYEDQSEASAATAPSAATPADNKQPAESLFTGVTIVDFYGSQITDDDLPVVQGLTKLKGLNLGKTKITDAGLKHLAKLTRLRSLDLSGTKINGAGLEDLKGLTKLQTLNIASTPISDAGLAHLQGLTQLQTLNLGQMKISDAGLEHLKGLTKLQTLILDLTPINGAAFARLTSLTQLQTLSLIESQMNDDGLSHLKGMSKLRNLNCASATESATRAWNILRHCHNSNRSISPLRKSMARGWRASKGCPISALSD